MTNRIIAAVLLSLMLVNTALARPIVRISTTYGNFSVELLDDAAPATVENFLNYVHRGDYDGTFIHRSVTSTGLDVIQGGGYRFQPFVGPVAIPSDPPVVNEFNVSNTRGTLAMAKFSGDPDSATSQWFVNLDDNSENLDEQNGGFTVFAQVLGEGLVIADTIAEQDTYNFGSLFQEMPLRGDNSSTVLSASDVRSQHFITISALETQRFSSALHVFESFSNRLITTVDAGDEGWMSLNMSLIASDPEIIFQINRDSIVPLAVNPDGAATFSATDNRLRIPSLELNENGNLRLLSNVVLVLIDAQTLRFRLESYDQ